MESVFEHLPIATISDTVREELESPFSTVEVVQAIQNMENGKTLGLDGFSVEFSNKSSQTLKTPLLNMLEDSFNNGHLPSTLHESCIYLI